MQSDMPKWEGVAPLVPSRYNLVMKKPRTRLPADGGKAHPNRKPVSFSLEELVEHRQHKISSWKHLRNTPWRVILTSPLIYVCVLPFFLVDASVALFQLVCFPIYGIPKVARKDYLVFDRGRLAYLNTIEKVGCIYCSYANGLLALITEIAARTEQHFCPIKHAHRLATTPSRYGKYLPYGDARAYRAQSEAIAKDYDDIAPEGK